MTQPVGSVRVGIGGWTYEPWRETFYPAGTVQSRELDYASRQVTTIEINGTFYRLQKPAVFRKWHDATPENFIFSLKAPRYIVQHKDLSTAGNAMQRFISSGIAELRAKLGPVLWQLAPTKVFEAGEIDAFISLLPATVEGLPLRHAMEVRHASFMNAEFIDIARKHGVAVVFEDDAKHPGCADISSTFVYARLRRCVATLTTGYPQDELQRWSQRVRLWAQGGEPDDLPRVLPRPENSGSPRDVFIYFINGAKERAPAAARTLLTLLESK